MEERINKVVYIIDARSKSRYQSSLGYAVQEGGRRKSNDAWHSMSHRKSAGVFTSKWADRERGGTYYTIRKAREMGISVTNLYKREFDENTLE